MDVLVLQGIQHAVEQNKELLEDLSVEPLSKGTDTNGKDLGIYSRNYGYKVKGRIKPVDLKLTGDFYKGMQVRFKNDAIVVENIDSDINKVMWLIDNYGEDIIGLPFKEALDVIQNDIIQFTQSKI